MYYFGRTLLLFCRPTQQASGGAFPVTEEGEGEYQNIPNKAINRENFAANWVKSIPHLQPIHIRLLVPLSSKLSSQVELCKLNTEPNGRGRRERPLGRYPFKGGSSAYQVLPSFSDKLQLHLLNLG